MTVDPSRLLQMLEPTVRPGSQPVQGVAGQGKQAFENRSFDDLLNEAKTGETSQEQVGGKESPQQTNPLAALGGLGQVENAALRNVLAQAHGVGTDSGKTE